MVSTFACTLFYICFFITNSSSIIFLLVFLCEIMMFLKDITFSAAILHLYLIASDTDLATTKIILVPYQVLIGHHKITLNPITYKDDPNKIPPLIPTSPLTTALMHIHIPLTSFPSKNISPPTLEIPAKPPPMHQPIFPYLIMHQSLLSSL